MKISCRMTFGIFCFTVALLQSNSAGAFVVTGTVLDEASAPVANVNVDFINSSGVNVALSGDSTQINGTFSVDVPSDTYSITYTPPPGSGLAGGEQRNVVVAGDQDLPAMILVEGYQINLQAVDSSGVPLPEINVKFKNASGVTVFAPVNTSDSGGNVSTVVPKSGVPYTMAMEDVGGRGYAVKEFINVAPGANVNYGEIIIGPARAVTGRTVRYSDGSVVAGVNFDLVDESGLEIGLKNDLSDAAGFFSLAGVSDGEYLVLVRPPGATGLSRREFKDVLITADFAFGDIRLGTEHSLTGRVVNSSDVPLQGIDLNMTDEYYDEQIFLNNDNTISDGTFSVMATDGEYTIHFRPPTSSPYAPKTLFNVAVNGSVDLGTIVLENYVTLSGTVRDFNGQPVANVDLDVIDLTAQEEVFTPNDKTNAEGSYASRLAPGTWKLVYSPPATRPDLRSVTFTSHSVMVDTTLDVTLQTSAASATDWQLYR